MFKVNYFEESYRFLKILIEFLFGGTEGKLKTYFESAEVVACVKAVSGFLDNTYFRSCSEKMIVKTVLEFISFIDWVYQRRIYFPSKMPDLKVQFPLVR